MIALVIGIARILTARDQSVSPPKSEAAAGRVPIAAAIYQLIREDLHKREAKQQISEKKAVKKIRLRVKSESGEENE